MVAHHTPPFIIEATNGYGKQGLKSLEYHAILLKFNWTFLSRNRHFSITKFPPFPLLLAKNHIMGDVDGSIVGGIRRGITATRTALMAYKLGKQHVDKTEEA